MPRHARCCLLLLFVTVVVVRSAGAASLGPWTVGTATNGSFAHNGIAGVGGNLYTVTALTQAEAAHLNPDGSLGAWTVAGSLNAARSYAITVASSTHVYVVGGFDGLCCGASRSDTEVAAINPDGTLSPWVVTSSMAVPRSNHAGAIGSGRIYVLGNLGGGTAVESAAIEANGSLSAWRPETAMQQSRERGAAAVVGGYLYVVGGLPFTLSVERAPIGPDGVLGAWEYASPNLKARYEVGAAAIPPFLFSVGGYNDDDGAFASVEMANTTDGSLATWSFSSPLQRPCYNCDAAAVGMTLYAVGGGDGHNVEYARLEGVDDDGDGVFDVTEPSFCLGSESGVPTTRSGCSTGQACPCSAPLGRSSWNRRGEYRGCVREILTELRAQSRVTAEQRRAIMGAARAGVCGLS